MYKCLNEMSYKDILERISEFYNNSGEAYRLLKEHFPERPNHGFDGARKELRKFFDEQSEVYRKHASSSGGRRRDVIYLSNVLNNQDDRSAPAKSKKLASFNMGIINMGRSSYSR